MNSDLALKKADYESEYGDFMGWGRGEAFDETAWDERKLRSIRVDVASGLRRFYYCGHPWSFLSPEGKVYLKSGFSTVELPDDFGGVEGGVRVKVENSSGVGLVSLPLISPSDVSRLLGENNEATGCPQKIAQRPIKRMEVGKMQRSELVVFPVADQAYTLKIEYYITPNYLLDVTQPYAYGGVEHHETILECVLAVAEQRRDNALGIHSAKAEDLLRKSISMDRRKKPTHLGYNGDRSDGVDWDWLNRRGWQNGNGGVTINDTLYS